MPDSTPLTEATLSFSGEIDLAKSPEMRGQLLECASKHPQRLTVDLREVSYMDSSGLAALIEAYQELTPHGGKLVLAGVQERVMTVLRIARLDQVFEIGDIS